MKIGEIEKNVRLPHIYGKYQYPFEKMEIGDSFLLIVEKNDILKQMQSSVSSCARNYGRANGNKGFLTRKVENGIRIWRFA